MIPVAAQPEPADFDRRVRQPGLAFLAGQGITHSAPSELRWKDHWRHCLVHLHAAYDGICAFLGVYIEPVTGARTVEHFRPKRTHPQLAYEWSNYRLVCNTLNGRKGDHEDVLDPFTLAPDTFCIEFTSGRIYPDPVLEAREPVTFAAAEATIRRLRLDDAECRGVRTAHFGDYLAGDVSADFLRRHSPFVWYELRRQGLL
ncbi:hypothetical protein [Plasticicumulans sp.]|uniref:hypothetical protein n=1 Tax=Plasticicumulans sp. TaxID=2307179 RepID=UPI002D1F9EAC|nr:hypothetical protein [Plasticicumulans sp.]